MISPRTRRIAAAAGCAAALWPAPPHLKTYLELRLTSNHDLTEIARHKQHGRD